MAEKEKTAEGYELLVRELKKNPQAEYATLRDRAEKSGFTIYPVMFGRAKASLGLVATKPRKDRAHPRVSKTKGKRGPGRPRKTPQPLDLGDLVAMVQQLQRERDDAIARLEKIRSVLA